MIERRVFVALAAMYAALVLAVLPWAQLPGPRAPQIIAVCNGGIALADLCTALLLGREFRRAGRLPFLLLACAYAYGCVMAIAQAVAFPGALFQTSFGTAQTPAWLFIAWRIGTAALFVAAVMAAARPAMRTDVAARALRRAIVLTLAALCAIIVLAAVADVRLVVEGRFTLVNLTAISLYFALCAFALFRIWRMRLARETLFLWLAIVLVASLADQVLATFGGGQYTFGWHLGKATAVVSACVLLVLWLGDLNARDDATMLRVVAGYGAALVVILAALVLRWFITPWVGYDVPFGTVFGAVAIAVWAGGWKPATLAAVVGFAGAAMFFLDPASVFRSSGAANLLGALVYFGSCALIIGLGESLRRARDRYDVAERRFRASQEVSMQGYALLSAVRDGAGAIRDFRWEYINPQGAAMARARPEALIGRLVRETLPMTMQSGVFDAFVRVVETGEPSDREVRYQERGVEGWLRNVVVKVGDGVSASFFDISQTKRLEAELRQRAFDLQRADVNKSEFLAVLSHELRNPLAPLLTGLSLLQLQHEPHALAATRDMMGRQIENLRRLIDDLLDVSRIDRGKLELLREIVTVDAVVRNAIETAQPGIDAKAQQLSVHVDDPALCVEGDPVRVAQIVANLVSNASKFTPAGGRIDVRVAASNDLAVISVRDNGIGFAPGDERRMFDMFVQLDSGPAGAGGLGLGLTLARRLAELHGGSLDARSAGPGQGAEFVLRLPATPGPVAPAAGPPPQRKQAPRRRILVVDDNADAADSLAQILLIEGFDVRAYYDPLHALDDADEWRPDVAFVDLNMPGMTGVELAHNLRMRPWSASLRLVAVTGMGQAADIESTRRAGFHAHVTKPAATDRIVALASEDAGAQAAD